ncbi:MAG: universal stress protein [Crenarchaeota archaeon]|nr:MAG: universal stress protein [Thermoproteota archaeon]RDJ33958.1 MAG: universal stress protein [Thermoproteota archaeon]RDJ36927.1 MAG: universal stress protein [Thermoproteota archaeon]RDJ37538.1 MAG: universal stress protein [Thermoproteota archaeon]
MISHILVPYDFTNFADLAFEKAIEIAKKFDSKVTLITVLGSDTDTSGMSFSRAQEAHDEAESKAKDGLNKMKDAKKMEEIEISVKIIHHSSSIDGILAYAESNNVDLIVMGSHGRSGFKKLVLGSIASGIITKSNCPVMIVKKPKKR